MVPVGVGVEAQQGNIILPSPPPPTVTMLLPLCPLGSSISAPTSADLESGWKLMRETQFLKLNQASRQLVINSARGTAQTSSRKARPREISGSLAVGAAGT